MDNNRRTYNDSDVVNAYLNDIVLQEAEKVILDKYKSQLNVWKMLDIGVGGGRTTYHFAKHTAEYIGIDYSEEMISACSHKYQGLNYKFKVCNVLDMSDFADNYFDFVLFSFNGIDYMTHEERQKALQEVKRVIKKGGTFVFSTHNIFSIVKYVSILYQLSLRPLTMLRKLKAYFLMKRKNNSIGDYKSIISNNNYITFNDGAHEYRLMTYYVNPLYQLGILKRLFGDAYILSPSRGNIIEGEADLKKNKDYWLYYCCTVTK